MRLGDNLNCSFFQLLPVNDVSPCKKSAGEHSKWKFQT